MGQRTFSATHHFNISAAWAHFILCDTSSGQHAAEVRVTYRSNCRYTTASQLVLVVAETTPTARHRGVIGGELECFLIGGSGWCSQGRSSWGRTGGPPRLTHITLTDVGADNRRTGVSSFRQRAPIHDRITDHSTVADHTCARPLLMLRTHANVHRSPGSTVCERQTKAETNRFESGVRRRFVRLNRSEKTARIGVLSPSGGTCTRR